MHPLRSTAGPLPGRVPLAQPACRIGSITLSWTAIRAQIAREPPAIDPNVLTG